MKDVGSFPVSFVQSIFSLLFLVCFPRSTEIEIGAITQSTQIPFRFLFTSFFSVKHIHSVRGGRNKQRLPPSFFALISSILNTWRRLSSLPANNTKEKRGRGDSNKRRTKILINIEKQKNFEGWASCYAQLSSVYLKSKREQRCHSSTHTTLRIRIFLRFSLHFLIELEFFDLFSVCLMHFDVRCTGCVARFRLSVSNDRVDRTWPVYCDLINYGRWLIDPAICSTQFWLGWVGLGGFEGDSFTYIRVTYEFVTETRTSFFLEKKNKKCFDFVVYHRDTGKIIGGYCFPFVNYLSLKSGNRHMVWYVNKHRESAEREKQKWSSA